MRSLTDSRGWLHGFGLPQMTVAAFLMISVASCSQSLDPGKVAVAPQLPTLPLALTVPVVMPGLDPDARIALLDHRVALAVCRGQVENLVEFYTELANGLGGRTTVE